MECRTQKAREWQVRMLEDVKHNTNGKFVTLTYSDKSIKEMNDRIQREIDESIDKLRHGRFYGDKERKLVDKLNKMRTGYELDNQIATRGMRMFNERWRKKNGKAIRHWTITELGHNGTENIHLHGILWTDAKFIEIADQWGYGYIWPRPDDKKAIKKNYVNGRTVNYIVKYIIKQDYEHKEYKSKILTSPGIGRGYEKSYNAILNKYRNDGKTDDTYRTKTGHKIAMPIYWRNKIYSEQEREKLWLEKLDKQVRYIRGEKIDISKGMEEYWNILEWYRKRNKELGYGDNQYNWKRKEYEEEMRIIKQATRIERANINAFGGK